MDDFDSMKFGKLARLAQERYGLGQEMLDQMDSKADIVAWLKAQPEPAPSKGPPPSEWPETP